MNILERRLFALEQANPVDRIDAIIHRIVTPGELDAEATMAREIDGAGEWRRLADESEDDLIDRALREIPRRPGGVARLIVSP
ncbi:MAG: hypothetical protein H6929_20020 [Rhodoferax sp.]|nr:hypothetical protein [Rhodoferax sp.]